MLAPADTAGLNVGPAVIRVPVRTAAGPGMAHAALEVAADQDESDAMHRPESFPAALPAPFLHRERCPGSQPRARWDETDEHAAQCRRACHEYAAACLALATLGRCYDLLG